jgi:hypothetical protein
MTPRQDFDTATFSDDGLYRYTLTRSGTPGVGESQPCDLLYLMLNPSTANASKDDATIRRCRGFSIAHGYRGELAHLLYERPVDDASRELEGG